MADYDLLVIDDFGLMDLDMSKCRDLFEIIESRDDIDALLIYDKDGEFKLYQSKGLEINK